MTDTITSPSGATGMSGRGMNTIEKTIFQDLIDGNACIGPDGGIWYPSGPSGVAAAKIFTALVNEARSHRKKLEHCKYEFDRAYEGMVENARLLTALESSPPRPDVDNGTAEGGGVLFGRIHFGRWQQKNNTHRGFSFRPLAAFRLGKKEW